MTSKKHFGVGVIGMGWMGDVHARSYRAAQHRFQDLGADIELVACADANEDLAKAAKVVHNFSRYETDWQAVIDDKSIDAISITAPNFLHTQICTAAAAVGKHIWCEKPAGRNAVDTAIAYQASKKAKVATMSGFNYHWTPMVRYVADLLKSGELGEIELFKGSFFSMYASDPMSLFSWRFKYDQAGNGVIGDLLAHVSDMAIEIAGPIKEVSGQTKIFIKERPIPKPGKVSHYGRGEPGDPTATVENEDFCTAQVTFANGAVGVLEACRTVCGPQAGMSFELYCSEGSVKWTLEDMNALQVYIKGEKILDGYTRVLAGERHPGHATFNPGDGIPIGFEETKVIECSEFVKLALAGKTEPSGLGRASEVADIGAAVIRSAKSGSWEKVTATDPNG